MELKMVYNFMTYYFNQDIESRYWWCWIIRKAPVFAFKFLLCLHNSRIRPTLFYNAVTVNAKNEKKIEFDPFSLKIANRNFSQHFFHNERCSMVTHKHEMQDEAPVLPHEDPADGDDLSHSTAKRFRLTDHMRVLDNGARPRLEHLI